MPSAMTAFVPKQPEAAMRHDPASGAIIIMLRSLKMYGLAQAATDLMEQGAPAFEAVVPILSQLLKAELAEREVRSIAYHMKAARFPADVPVVTRADYAFDVAAPDGSLPSNEAGRLDAWFRSLDLGYGDSIYIDGAYAAEWFDSDSGVVDAMGGDAARPHASGSDQDVFLRVDDESGFPLPATPPPDLPARGPKWWRVPWP